MLKLQPQSPERIATAVALFMVGVLNWPFWRAMLKAVEPSGAYEWSFLAAVFLVATAAYTLSLVLIAPPRLFKVIASSLLILSATASYYLWEYGVVIDRNMIANVFETNTSEAADLITPGMVAFVVGLGVLPSWLLWKTPIDTRPWARELFCRGRVALLALVVAAASAATFFMNVTSVFRQHGELKQTLAPYNVLAAVEKYVSKKYRSPPAALAHVGTDAHMAPGRATPGVRSVLVLVIGETARADHFALNGYDRPTTPQLSSVAGLINFANVHSCGTDTAQSLPCIFSSKGRAEFDSDIAGSEEGLLDILKRAGIDVLWRENQSGCKGVCSRVPAETLTQSKIEKFCGEGECHDDILLSGLAGLIAKLDRNAVIVLHMMGSHGPAYHKRYPAAFEQFTPACHESQFSRCSNAEIVNAYDNTFRYTDHVLGSLIGILRQSESIGIASSMIYVSDHGESLGENNLYLHGMPYALAPEAQRHVPMVAWLSNTAQKRSGIDTGCLKSRAAQPLSHDNLFHSVLGLSGVATRVYNKDLDIFAACRATPTAMPRQNPGQHPL